MDSNLLLIRAEDQKSLESVVLDTTPKAQKPSPSSQRGPCAPGQDQRVSASLGGACTLLTALRTKEMAWPARKLSPLLPPLGPNPPQHRFARLRSPRPGHSRVRAESAEVALRLQLARGLGGGNTRLEICAGALANLRVPARVKPSSYAQSSRKARVDSK